MGAATVARLQITLDGVKPAVLRPVEVPFDIRLDRLHLTIQAANRQGMSRTHAFYKMIAMVRGANIVRRELGLPEAEIPANDGRLLP